MIFLNHVFYYAHQLHVVIHHLKGSYYCLFSEKGIDYMFKGVSETAEYGGQTRADRLIDEDIANEMKEILNEIKSGDFHREWMAEADKGLSTLKQYREPNETEKLFNELTKLLLPMIKK